MKTYSSFSQLCHSPMLRCAAVMLVALSWSSLAFCGEIHDAARDGNLEKVKALIKNNPDLVFSKDDKYNGQTPLHAAASHDHNDVVELLLANKAEVNATNNDGDTPLHAAAFKGHKDVAELLLANKADVNARDNYGWTALHTAVLNRHKDMAELLLASNADVNAQENVGNKDISNYG